MSLDVTQTKTMSTTASFPNPATSTYPSPSQTVVDLEPNQADKAKSTRTGSISAPTQETTEKSILPENEPEVKLSQTRKWSLLAVFSMGLFIDIWSYSAFFIFTDPISEDLAVPFAQQSWVIVSRPQDVDPRADDRPHTPLRFPLSSCSGAEYPIYTLPNPSLLLASSRSVSSTSSSHSYPTSTRSLS